MDDFLIVVGTGAAEAATVLEEVLPGATGDILSFSLLSELDSWRRSQRAGAGLTIEIDVTTALRELARPRVDLRGEVAAAIENLCRLPRIPRVSQLPPEEGSERTFHRRWSEQIPETPKRFLNRVRLLHARRLIEQEGFSAKEAAFRVGFPSVFALRQALVERAETNATVVAG